MPSAVPSNHPLAPEMQERVARALRVLMRDPTYRPLLDALSLSVVSADRAIGPMLQDTGWCKMKSGPYGTLRKSRRLSGHVLYVAETGTGGFQAAIGARLLFCGISDDFPNEKLATLAVESTARFLASLDEPLPPEQRKRDLDAALRCPIDEDISAKG